MSTPNILFTSLLLNPLLTLKNRIVMAPMTRNMAHDDLSPTVSMKEYYARRADAGLIITEGTVVAYNARGYSHTPGIFTTKQTEQWKAVTDAVHERDGRIFLQLWHVGRVSHPDFINGQLPISASATSMTGKLSRSELTYVQAKAADENDIDEVIHCFRLGAKNAMLAGFDGVEIHGANGYLIDQFLHYDTNKRTDQYGITPENMARLPLAVVNACGSEIGYERVSIRLSPGAYLHQVAGDVRDAAVFSYLLHELNKLMLCYVHTGNVDDAVRFDELNQMTMTAFIRKNYTGMLIASGNYQLDDAETKINNGEFDLVSIGRPFIANPDLVQKAYQQTALIPFNPDMLTVLY